MKEMMFTFETRPGIRWGRTSVVFGRHELVAALDHKSKPCAYQPPEAVARVIVNRALFKMNGGNRHTVDDAALDAHDIMLVGFGEREEGFSLTQLAR